MKLWKYIREALTRYPDHTVSEDDAAMHYDELCAFAELFAQKIEGQKCCAILCNSEMAGSMALLACFAAGVTALPLPLRYGARYCNKILQFVSPTALITDLNGELQVLDLYDSAYEQPPEHPALVMCSSGTTGEPKGIMLSEENILSNLQDIAGYFDLTEQDRILIARPLYHVAVLTGEFLTALVKGTDIVFWSGGFDPFALKKLIARRSVTTLGGTPTLFDALMRCYRCPAGLLKNIVVSGECLPATVADKLKVIFGGARIYHVYGLSEASPRVAFLPPEKFSAYSACVGIPLPSVRYKILDGAGKPVGKGSPGVLWISGPNIMIGYYKAPDRTAEVLRDGWLCTGDIAVCDPSGFLKILGRADDMIIRAGMNIYPQEIENTLRTDERVREVCVRGFGNEQGGTQIAMKIAGDFAAEEEVRALCRALLPDFQIPSQIRLVTHVSRTPSGKMIRKGA